MKAAGATGSPPPSRAGAGGTLSRRAFLARGAALAALPLAASAGAPAEADVVVVGAGAAGLAATRVLRERGVSVATVEASGRIGGRAHTDTRLFGVPCDMGAHWLHNAAGNPFVGYAREHGFDAYPAPVKETLYTGSRKASPAEYAAYEAAHAGAIRAISAAGRRGEDTSPAAVVPDGGEWHDLVHFVIGPWEMGKDFDDFSCVDWWNSEGGSDWYCKQGYGALVAHGGRDLEVLLATRAERIRWGGKGVSVDTNRGTLRARHCIVTVSTGVLAKGDLRFSPELPAAKTESFHGISMGFYDHVALLFDEDVLGTGADEYLLYNADTHGAPSPALMGLLTNVSGTRLTLADVGGDFAAELEDAGPDAAVDFARSELGKIFGARVRRHLVKAHFTRWGRNPLTRGAYASARPGAYPLRAVLREPVAERVWFAGEACSEGEWATVGGAHESGRRIGERVAAALAAKA